MARLSEQGIRLSCMSPTYLNSNSTSHTWPFSAVAELVDNASDPGVTAKQIWIDVLVVKEQLCLTFIDNGNGMTPSKLHKMLSFGFTDKGNSKTSQPIGVYGNGFKSGSMRLGKDALIFTKNGGCISVGMLSQSYLEAVNAQAVVVPIVPFNQQTKKLVVTEDSEASLQAILTHSLFSSQEELLEELESIPSKKGTKILIWNIRRNKDGNPELDFNTDKYDIRMPPIRPEDMGAGGRKRCFGPQRTDQTTPEMDYSLRAYLSILYLKPRAQIILRQKKVLTKLVSKSLSSIENDVYKPTFNNKKVKITFGFNYKNREHFGILMYHRNRLIKSYEKVGCQVKSSGQRSGVGVVGIIECNFLKPAHNKQDFEYTKEYRLTLAALGMKLNDYWKKKREQKSKEKTLRALARKSKKEGINREDEKYEDEEEQEEEEEDWIQCEDCLKWRRLPPGVIAGSLPEKWTCSQHPTSCLRSCLLPEEADESDDELTPSYQKASKKQEKERKNRLQEKGEDHCSLSAVSDHAESPEVEESESDCRLPNAEEDVTSPSRKRKATHSENSMEKRKFCVTEIQKDKDSEREKTGDGDVERIDTGEIEGEADDTGVVLFGKLVTPVDMTKKDQNKFASALTWAHAPAPTQTVMVPPLSRTEDQTPIPFSSEGMDSVAVRQRLAQLEREADKLRRILGNAPLNSSPVRDDSCHPPALDMPTQDKELLSQGSNEATGKLLSLATERDKYKKEVSELQQRYMQLQETWEKEHQELLLLRDQLSGPQGFCWGKKLQLHDLEAKIDRLQGEEEDLGSRQRQDEKRLNQKDTQDQSTSMLNTNESITLKNLREVRQNVVSLLSSILPHLDLQDISYDTDDVDSILRQIIEANGLQSGLQN
ncbi:MORC family CW-type zinc finger protein 4 isoform X1 [Brienomyrus brachyistius]|uniref:MORC family CW-type zinc finger protein 4 isoform X1 n=2 Tax=Brienomyrus brachyistius TaxID=42636 RepID=UPI0020B1F55A|nr:MORC family CW-type zinc finger protein 4 isoform X1 [Brienomyrus brachyistius]